LYIRQVLGLRPAPEFEAWLEGFDAGKRRQLAEAAPALVTGSAS
jgi:ethanolamine ammonia-lyase large subunit